ncbi:MAG: nicotinamide-nucleotide amidohydrolase family protein [Simkaniaceae bacterium]
MLLEIISIGDELLNGRTVNTNATFMARECEKRGLSIDQITTVKDDKEALLSALNDATKRGAQILLTGGLGPTSDDKTKEILSGFLSLPLEKNETVSKDLFRRYKKEIPDQALLPRGATPFLNRVGTAPGFKIQNLVALPGVPEEMEEMFERVLDNLDRDQSKKTVAEFHLMLTSEGEISSFTREAEAQFPDAQFGFYPSMGSLAIRISGKRAFDVESEFQKNFPKRFFKESKSSSALQSAMIQSKQTLSVAESCTGGKIASILTENSDASHYFLGGVVAYSNKAKMNLLDVHSNILSQNGAVSREAVIEMAEGVQQKFNSDIGISTSGIAGPKGGIDGKPVGTVWGAIKVQGMPAIAGLIPCCEKEERKAIISKASYFMIGALWRLIVHGEKVWP